MATTQSFNDLFGSSGNSYVYYVDTVYEYTDFNAFKALLAFDAFLGDYNNPVLRKVDYAAVQERIRKKPDPPNVSTTWTSWQRDTVEIMYTRNRTFTTSPSSLVNEIMQSTKDIKLNEVSKSHNTANMFMEQVMFSIGKWKYTDLRDKLVKNYNQPPNSNIDINIKTAINRIGALVGQTNDAILAELKKASADALDFWVKDKPAELFLIAGLNEGGSFNTTSIRNALRDYIYKNLYLTAINEPNDAVLQYMKRILADLFIVCFYPYLHYLYASQLQVYFLKRGNFINMRAATSAKINVVINSMKAIKMYADGGNESIASPNQVLTAQEITQLTAIQTKLQEYLDNLSNPVFEEPNKKYGDIDIEIRNLSKDVYDTNLTIDDLKKWIKDTQLQIRSHSTIYKGMDGVLNTKKIQYILHIFFIVVLLAVVGTLIKFNLYLDIVMYVLSFIIAFFVIVRIASIIVSLL